MLSTKVQSSCSITPEGYRHYNAKIDNNLIIGNIDNIGMATTVPPAQSLDLQHNLWIAQVVHNPKIACARKESTPYTAQSVDCSNPCFMPNISHYKDDLSDYILVSMAHCYLSCHNKDITA